jgi:signal transduction histidine kinase
LQNAAVDIGLALARTISADRVLQELSQQLRRALVCESVAIALTSEESAQLELKHQVGFSEDPGALSARLTPRWNEALERGQVVTQSGGDGTEITAPMTSEHVRGAITVSVTALPAPTQLEETRQALAVAATQTAAALSRAEFVRRACHKQRLDAIAEVSTGVAHELRNPLFGISSAAQLLRFRVKDDPVVEKNVGRILREVERLNGMATGLLEYGRPNPIHLHPGDPDSVWDEVIANERGRLESRALLLQRKRVDAATKCMIDPSQLAQVFINLLSNAADAAPEGSDLALESVRLPNGSWRCRLHNDGQTVPPDVLARAFEVFFSTKPGNTGLGLALSQRIVEEHGGTISLKSEPQLGTWAVVTLPPNA